MTSADADARIAQWAVFAKPTGAADQVASLLGVTPTQDPGQPVAIALNAPVPVAARVTDAIDSFMPGEQTMGAGASVPVAAPVAAAVAEPAPATAQPAYHDVATAVAVPEAAAEPVKVTAFFAPRANS